MGGHHIPAWWQIWQKRKYKLYLSNIEQMAGKNFPKDWTIFLLLLTIGSSYITVTFLTDKLCEAIVNTVISVVTLSIIAILLIVQRTKEIILYRNTHNKSTQRVYDAERHFHLNQCITVYMSELRNIQLNK